MNLGVQWSPVVWQTVTSSVPGKHFVDLYRQKESQLQHSLAYKAKPESHAGRWKRKMASLKESQTQKAKQSYGEQAVDVTPDVSTETLKDQKEDFLKKNIDLDTKKIIAIQKSTTKQSMSGLWHSERRNRVTSSHFGSIVKKNVSRPVTPLVRRLLYSTFNGNQHTANGLQQERVTVQEYILKKAEGNINVTVESMGLVIDQDNKFLAGSPDGKVHVNGEAGLIEIKNLLHNKPYNLWQAAAMTKAFCLQEKNKMLTLKQNHLYYYQCQGLLNICGLEWLDFVVQTVNPYQLHIEEIRRDKDLWVNTMVPKLSAFYHGALLPELACPRYGQSPGIREPGVWVGLLCR